MNTIPQHTRDEFRSNANGNRAWRWANRKLNELTTETDEWWVEQLRITYLQNLHCGHKQGMDGSLLHVLDEAAALVPVIRAGLRAQFGQKEMVQ